MPPRYQQQLANGGYFNSGVRPQSTQPDYSSAIDSITAAFSNTRDGIVKRAMMQQEAQRQRMQADREAQMMQIQQRHADLQESEQANKMTEAGYDEVDPTTPQISPDGKPVQTTKIGNRAFVFNPAKTPQAMKDAASKAEMEQRRQSLAALAASDKKLTPEAIDFLVNNPKAYDAYGSAKFGPSSERVDPNSPEVRQEKIQDQKSLMAFGASLREKTGGSGSGDKAQAEKDKWVRARALELTKPQAGKYGTSKPGLDMDAAASQARNDWATLNGDVVPKSVRKLIKPVTVSYDASTSDADLWEKYHGAGLSPEAATAKVKARKVKAK